MKYLLGLLASSILACSAASAQNCRTAVECIEEKLVELRSFEERLATLEATQTAIQRSILISYKTCEVLGPGWSEYERAFGRFLLSRNPSSPDLAESLGGSADITITKQNLPEHNHAYQDTFYSLDRTPQSGATRIEVPGKTGSGKHDYNNWGHQFSRNSEYSGGVKSPTSISILPPFIRVHYCVFG